MPVPCLVDGHCGHYEEGCNNHSLPTDQEECTCQAMRAWLLEINTATAVLRRSLPCHQNQSGRRR
eukprot:12054613-Heterocapsa_arctica.AAC.1